MSSSPQEPPVNGSADMVDPVPLAPPLPTLKERLAEGKALRAQVNRSAQGTWQPAANRPDPIALLEESSRPRLQHLVPIRYGRMLQSPFTFLRGSPIVMAQDLASTPNTKIEVQLGGDAHLMNFGVYASPERHLLFDINDFDETLPGPWEWDLKRLAASCVVAARTFGMSSVSATAAARACAQSYRENMRRYGRMRLLDVWYSRVDAQAALELFQRASGRPVSNKMNKELRQRTLKAVSKLTTVQEGQLRIVDDPPLVTHSDDAALSESIRRRFHGYYGTLADDRRFLLERYRFLDFALKVVGVGSVGTRCYIILLDSSQSADPLLLQIKEARASVLEAHLGKSKYRNSGHRVVTGQRLMQSASDMFLGWMHERGHDYYVRQLRDMKATATLETMKPEDLAEYSKLCGWVLARAHARSGDAVRISGYLGKSETFDEAIADFGNAYADQNDRDYEDFQAAVRSGRLSAETGI